MYSELVEQYIDFEYEFYQEFNKLILYVLLLKNSNSIFLEKITITNQYLLNKTSYISTTTITYNLNMLYVINRNLLI